MASPLAQRGLSLAGWTDARLPSGVRQRLTLARAHAFRFVTLDAMDPQTRPRDLDRSSRRDLGVTLRREGLACCGFDLWIPPAEVAMSSNWQRIVDSVEQCASCLRQISDEGGSINMSLVEGECEPLIESLHAVCQRHGVVVSDHAWPARDDERLTIGFDPATIIASGRDPHDELALVASRVGSLRLSDLDASGRVAVGRGSVEPVALEASSSALGCVCPWVVDVRGVPDQREAIEIGSAPIVEPGSTG